MTVLRRHVGLLLLMGVIAPLTLWFVDQDGIASLGNDSVSYLTLARHYAGSISPALAPWVPYQSHFPPLFPLVLAATGGDESLRVAHAVVGVFGVVAVAMVYWYGLIRFERRMLALLLAGLFLLTPGAWISIKAILSESLFLAISLAAICFYEARLARDPAAPPAQWVLFGLLLAAAALTRQAGLVLVAAYAIQAAFRMIRAPKAARRRLALPLVVWAAAAALWAIVNVSTGSGEHQRYIGAMVRAWSENPLLLMQGSARIVGTAWISSFTADIEVSLVPKVMIGLLGALAVIGAGRRAMANHLDGWYTLGALAAAAFYITHEDDTRRMLYAILPLLLAHAGGLMREAAHRPATPRHQKMVLGAVALVPAFVCLPALILVAQRAIDMRPLYSSEGHAARDITDYYTTINSRRARAIAARHAAVIHGLERLKETTPPEARVMWIRPEYVALLGERHAVPLYLDWDGRALAKAIRDSETSHVVLATLYKSDLEKRRGNPIPLTRTAEAYSDRAFALKNPVTGSEEFALLEVDRGRLERYLAAAGAMPAG